MTKETMIRNYRKLSAADSYIIGFIYKKMLYFIEVEEIMPRFMKVEYSSSANGHKRKLQLRLNNKFMEQLIKKGATCLGSETLLGEGNKGVNFERMIYILNNQEPREKDNVGFWVSGDITLNNKEVQIKFNGAQIVMEDTLKRLITCPFYKRKMRNRG